MKMIVNKPSSPHKCKVIAAKGKITGSIYFRSGFNINKKGKITKNTYDWEHISTYTHYYIPIYEGELDIAITG